MPFRNATNIFIDNVVCEVNILISQLPEEERRQIHDNTNLSPGDTSLRRFLSAQNCKVAETLKRSALTLHDR